MYNFEHKPPTHILREKQEKLFCSMRDEIQKSSCGKGSRNIKIELIDFIGILNILVS